MNTRRLLVFNKLKSECSGDNIILLCHYDDDFNDCVSNVEPSYIQTVKPTYGSKAEIKDEGIWDKCAFIGDNGGYYMRLEYPINILGDFTIEFWHKNGNGGIYINNINIFRVENEGYYNDGKVYINNVYESTIIYPILSGWNHFAYVYDSVLKQINIYENGVLLYNHELEIPKLANVALYDRYGCIYDELCVRNKAYYTSNFQIPNQPFKL